MPQNHVIETTAGNATAELSRLGIGPGEPVTLMIDASHEWVPGRLASRARVIAAGLSDDDIDRLIKEAQAEVEPPVS
jgi:hypothetical protein